MSKVNRPREVFITTYDNPFDYWTQFKEWLDFDRQKGYFTLELLARITNTSDELSEEEQQSDLEEAIDTIIEWNGSFYKKVFKS